MRFSISFCVLWPLTMCCYLFCRLSWPGLSMALSWLNRELFPQSVDCCRHFYAEPDRSCIFKVHFQKHPVSLLCSFIQPLDMAAIMYDSTAVGIVKRVQGVWSVCWGGELTSPLWLCARVWLFCFFFLLVYNEILTGQWCEHVGPNVHCLNGIVVIFHSLVAASQRNVLRVQNGLELRRDRMTLHGPSCCTPSGCSAAQPSAQLCVCVCVCVCDRVSLAACFWCS